MPIVNEPPSLSGVTVSGTAASGQVPVASGASAGVWAYPPGFELNYTAITAPVNVASTTEATGTTIISPGAITFDGTAVLVHFFTPLITTPTAAVGNVVTVSLFESTTQIGRLCTVTTSATADQNPTGASGFLRFTPTAAAHTYTITAFASSTTGTPAIGAGAGSTGAYVAAFVRFTKV